MEYVLLVAFVLGFAALYRLRGGSISDVTYALGEFRLGTHLTRLLCWVIPITGVFWWFAFAELPMFAEIASTAMMFALSWIGIAMGHGTFQDDGQSPQTLNYLVPYMPKYELTDPLWKRQLIDTVGMGLVHFMRAGFILVGAVWFIDVAHIDVANFVALPIAVLFSGVAYHVGWKIPLDLPQLEAKSTEWGEVLTGALYGTGFWLAFIY